MILNIYSVTQDGGLKIDQFHFLEDVKPTDKINIRHIFMSDLAKNRYEYYFGTSKDSSK